MVRLDRDDLKMWAVVFGAAVIIVAAAYFLAYYFTPRGYLFSGMLYDSHDGYTYRAWAEAFKQGGLLVDNPYSTFWVKPEYFNLVWFLLGKAMKYTGLPYLPVYYLFGILCGGAMYLAILALVREIAGDRPSARFAYLLIAFGSGFGWIVALAWPQFTVDIFPADLFCGDGFPFFSFLAFPHLSFSFFLLTMVYLWMYRATVLGRRRLSAGAGFLILLLGFFHPYHLVSILSIIGVWYVALTIKHGKKWLSHWIDYAILAVCALPSLVYFRYLFRANPNFSPWAAQNIVISGGIANVLIGLGLFLLLAAPGVWGLFSRRTFDDRHLLMIVWTAINLVLLFSYPFIKFERRLIQGIVLPLAILASWGFFGVILPLCQRPARSPARQVKGGHQFRETKPLAPRTDLGFLWALPFLLLTLPSYLIIVGNQLSGPIKGEFPFQISENTMMFIPKKLAQALDFASRNLAGSNILSSEEVGLVLPAFADVRSFIGHRQITPVHLAKVEVAKRFYGLHSTDADRLRSLAEWQIDYVWRGPEEMFMGQYDPSQAPFLNKVFDNGLISIYKVNTREAERFPHS